MTQRAGVDVGGTFTDVVALGGGRGGRAGGRLQVTVVKLPSTPEDQSAGVVAGLDAAGVPGARLVAHGTTTATNAVLERRVARTVLVTTEGFRDVLTIGRQERPALYDLSVVRPEPLVPRERVVTVRERTGSDGTPVVALSGAEVERVVAAVAALEPESVALCLLFAYAGDTHEVLLADALGARFGPAVPVTRSSALLPEFREYERASTVALDAAVAPVLRRYLTGLAARLPAARVTVMTSGGGTASLAQAAAAPVLTLLSGPAAGVVAAAAAARSAGFRDAIAFDMGGTSTDVCLVRDGRPDMAAEAAIGGLPFRTPAVAVHTVGAGGGSIAALDAGGALRVGPRSAGARPGPACYGHGGDEPTVTDAHCALGHLADGRELGGGLRLQRAAAERALSQVGVGVGTVGEPARSRPGAGSAATAVLPAVTEAGSRSGAGSAATAEGVLTVVRATMARALRRVSTERGVDPAGLALVAYGGAGPLHATALARELGCAAVVVPPSPGVLSALGLLLAPPRHEASRTVMATPDDPGLEGRWEDLAAEAVAAVEAAQGGDLDAGTDGDRGAVTVTRWADLRYAGQSHELRLLVDEPGADLAALLHAAHERAYGYAVPDEPVRVVTLRAVAEGRPALAAPVPAPQVPNGGVPERRGIGVGGGWVEVDVWQRDGLAPGQRIEGPALVEQPDTTTLLQPGDDAEVAADGALVVRGW